MPRTCVIATLAATLSVSAGLASAQTVNINILVDEPVLAPGDSTDVLLEAAFTTSDYAVAGIATDLVADSTNDVSGAWSDWRLIAPMDGPGTTPGGPDGMGNVTGIIAGQLNFPPLPPYPIPQNPIAFWTATFTAPTDGGGYRVDLSTLTSRYDIYPERSSSRSESRLDLLVEGEAAIFVVPAPGGAAVLVLGLGAATRRRR